MQEVMDAFVKWRQQYFPIDGTKQFVNAIAENGEDELARAFYAGWVMSKAPGNAQQQAQADEPDEYGSELGGDN